ncbi:MAG: hypothetical protein M1821_004383 [Bathelium mastoideum]|nr:MAG: hypothetical protein M1821_004383 [Bathelium mastoideum]
MSGNPFRRSTHVNTPASTLNADPSLAAERFPNIQDDSELQPRKTKKTVRITSPPQSPSSLDPLVNESLAQGTSPLRHPGSPPAPVIDDSSDSDTPTDDPFKKQSDAADDTSEEEALGQEIKRDSSKMISMNPQVAPQNPFQRTLASIEGSAQLGSNQTDGSLSGPSGTSTGKGGMDVDSFKRLLLTGKPGPQDSAPSATTPNSKPLLGAVTFDSSSSSTETSSLSRQSLFDYSHDARVESPRTSYERTDSDEEEHNERSSLMSSTKKKPPPPKPKHGKLVGPKGPQTVSFLEFEPSITSSNPRSHQRPGIPRVNSDLNKPLPPPPPFSTSPEQKPSVPWPESTQELPQTLPQEPTSSPSQSVDSVTTPSQRKQAPPVPLSRRHSQLRSSTQSRSRSNSSLTLPPQPEELQDNEQSSPTPAPASPLNTKAPPPPPTRRTGIFTKPSPPSAIPSHDSVPSPRPSRSGSNSSTTQRPHRASNASSTSSMIPPPLPPPRKAGNHRPSIEGRRPSITPHSPSIGSKSSPRRSLDQPTPTVMSPPLRPAPAEDVMRSMDEFQREVDALIAKAGR